MSKYTRKGYTTVKARDPKTGRLWDAPVLVEGKTAKYARHDRRKLERAAREKMRQFKAQLREAKKNVPLELRSKINWNNVERPK